MKTVRTVYTVLWFAAIASAANVDLSNAVVVTRAGALAPAESTAAKMFVEEIEKRTGMRLKTQTQWPAATPVIVIASRSTAAFNGHTLAPQAQRESSEVKPEAYRVYLDQAGAAPVLSAIGDDPRGTLFAAGQLLRRLDWKQGGLSVAGPLDISTAPAYPIRGHQLGYRAQANSYDAWSPAQFEQYIRELSWFGANSIEGIPLEDDRPTAVMKTPRREMNRDIGEICQRYGLDYWAWIPADFDLKDTERRAQFLERCNQFFKDTPTLTGVFFPGGDPGNNPPELVLPFLEDMGKLLLAAQPKGRIWLSLQWFTPAQVDSIYSYIDHQQPRWFAGLVAGPSSPPLGPTRRRLPKQYMLRDYPDLTHNKLSQFQVPEWDQAYALTLGREAVNPRPAEYAHLHNRMAGYTDGFISYSDGIHDDVNKTVWSARSWDPQIDVRDILVDYARAYFNPTVAQGAADAILGLERNWRGPLVNNGGVEGTLLDWQQLEQRAPQLESNWRWQMCLLRANYDTYDRHRLIRETKLEDEANRILLTENPDQALTRATAVLESAVTDRTSPELRQRIIDLCDKLFHSIGLQSSVDKYYASGEERGAVLDFIDYPLNNRWWLEDQFQKVRAMGSDAEKRQRLHTLATWEHPGQGSFYDDLGNVSNSPHVVSFESGTASEDSRLPSPTFWWWDQGKSRARLSWQTTLWPTAVVYEAVDPDATYVIRSSGYGKALLRINGDRVEPSIVGKEAGEISEWSVPSKYLSNRRLVLTWDRHTDEGHLNWRQKSRLAEVWLIKK